MEKKLPDLTDEELTSKGKKACNPTQFEYHFRTDILKEFVRRFDPKRRKAAQVKKAGKVS